MIIKLIAILKCKSDDIEIVIIELSKFKKYMNNTALADWVKFIINLKVIDMSNEEVKKAKEVLDELSQDEHERRLAELREKYIMDQKATEAAGYDKGLEQGLKQGFEQGIEQGEKNKTLELANKMKAQGLDSDTIHKITGISIDEINKL
ncbi:MAG: Rpn family recombination-promoting nuclease/putative transposase [Clostridia bacterium]